jgi:tRNA-Thr(GGU) m(6)t(6)A37 methyltransferase TsaA
MSVTFQPIGIIHSAHRAAEETPIQPVYARGAEGRAELLPEFAAGLRDLDGFSHVYLIYWLHEAGAPRLLVKPFLDDVERGVFATRAPCRPNPIGLSIVKLLRCEKNVVHVRDIDVLDQTPLLDIKPYVPRFDHRDPVKCGWIDRVDDQTAHARGHRAAPPKI